LHHLYIKGVTEERKYHAEDEPSNPSSKLSPHEDSAALNTVISAANSTSVTLIDSPHQVPFLKAALQTSTRLGFDNEADGLHHYQTTWCVAQWATDRELFIVDTLQPELRELVKDYVRASTSLIVVHDGGFDARLLARYGTCLPQIFDTSIAAKFLGEKNTGLSALLRSRLGIAIEKHLQQADWRKRPLGEDSIRYLADDVRYLLPLYDVICAEVQRAGIACEVAEETAYMLNTALKPPLAPPLWLQVPDARRLKRRPRAVLRELALWRDREASRQDRPVARVVPHRRLLDLATAACAREPLTAPAIKHTLRIDSEQTLSEVLAAIEMGLHRGDIPEEEHAWLVEKTPSKSARALTRRRRQALATWRAQQAALRGVDLQVILPGHCLNDLAEHGASNIEALGLIAGLGEFRIRHQGHELVLLLAEAENSPLETED